MPCHIDDHKVQTDAFTTLLTAVQRARDEAKTNETLLRDCFEAAYNGWKTEKASLIREINDIKRIQEESTRHHQAQNLSPKPVHDARTAHTSAPAPTCCHSASRLLILRAKYDRLSNDYKAQTTRYEENKTKWKQFKHVVGLASANSAEFRKALIDANQATVADLRCVVAPANASRSPAKIFKSRHTDAKCLAASPRKSPRRSILTPLGLSSANQASPHRGQSSPTTKQGKLPRPPTQQARDESYKRNISHAEKHHPARAAHQAEAYQEDEDHTLDAARQAEEDESVAAEVQMLDKLQGTEHHVPALRTMITSQPTLMAPLSATTVIESTPYVFPLPREALVLAAIDQDIIEESHVPNKRRKRSLPRFSGLRDCATNEIQPCYSPMRSNAMSRRQHPIMQADKVTDDGPECGQTDQEAHTHQGGISTVVEEVDEDATETSRSSGPEQEYQAGRATLECPPKLRASAGPDTSLMTSFDDVLTLIPATNYLRPPLSNKSAYAISHIDAVAAPGRPSAVSQSAVRGDAEAHAAFVHMGSALAHLPKEQGPLIDIISFVSALHQPRATLGDIRDDVKDMDKFTSPYAHRDESHQLKTAHNLVSLPQFDAAMVKGDSAGTPKTWINLKSQKRQAARLQDISVSSSPRIAPVASSAGAAAKSTEGGRRPDHLLGYQVGHTVQVARRPSICGLAIDTHLPSRAGAGKEAFIAEGPVVQPKKAHEIGQAMDSDMEADLRLIAHRVANRRETAHPVLDVTPVSHLRARQATAKRTTTDTSQAGIHKNSIKRKRKDGQNEARCVFASQLVDSSNQVLIGQPKRSRHETAALGLDAGHAGSSRPLKYAHTHKKARLLAIEKELAEPKFEVNPDAAANACAQVSLKRTKGSRKGLHAANCQCCQGYYEAKAAHLPIAERSAAIAQMRAKLSRHREELPQPDSPPEFWQMAFPSTQNVEIMNEQAEMQNYERTALKASEAEICGGRWRQRASI